MKTSLIAILGAAVLVLPAGAVAKPDGGADKRAAIKQCKAERGKTKATREAFKATYHSFSRCVRQTTAEERAERRAARRAAAKECKELHGKAYGQCVSAKAREHKAAEDKADAQQVQAFKNAAKECAAERSDPAFAAAHGGKTFQEFYGTNRNKRNAFGKCVSGKSKTYVDPL
jgi:hypothetical protein